MSMFRSINRFSSAPLAPTTLPATALLLVEINGQVFRLPANALLARVLPTTQPAVGGVWSDNGVVKARLS